MSSVDDRNYDPIAVFFEPKSVAIIGATGDRSKLGWHIVENFLLNYPSDLFFINPKGGEIEGRKVYKNLRDVPAPVDLVVMAIPAKYVLKAVEDAVAKEVKSIVIESGGFAEVSKEGRRMQEKIVELAHTKNIRIVGPNCIGILSPSDGVDTIFIPLERVARPGSGNIAMMTQSGALGSAVLSAFTMEGNGRWISRFVSFGNASDVNEYDLLDYFGRDVKTKVILSHLEGFKNGKKFMVKARKIAREKPIVLLKAGRTSLGAKASESHSGSVASNDSVVSALLKQHGIIRVNQFDEMINLAKTLEKQPIPRGNRVGIVTDGGGFAVMASDAVEREGLALGQLSKKTISGFKAKYPPYYISNNPLDLTGMVTAEELMFGVEQFCLDPNIDSIILIIIPSAPQFVVKDFLDLMTDFLTRTKPYNEESASKPILSISVGGEESKIINSKFDKVDIPTFGTVEEAMKMLKYLVEYRDFLKREERMS